jgi:hypothetical protein
MRNYKRQSNGNMNLMNVRITYYRKSRRTNISTLDLILLIVSQKLWDLITCEKLQIKCADWIYIF